MNRWIAAALLPLGGCTGQFAPVGRVVDQQTPIVEASAGGVAELQILACPKPENAAYTERAIDKLLMVLNTAGLLVTATDGSAKLIIDLCAGA